MQFIEDTKDLEKSLLSKVYECEELCIKMLIESIAKEEFLDWDDKADSELISFHKKYFNKNVFFDEEMNKKYKSLSMDYTFFYYAQIKKVAKNYRTELKKIENAMKNAIIKLDGQKQNTIILKNYLSFFSTNYIYNESWDDWYKLFSS